MKGAEAKPDAPGRRPGARLAAAVPWVVALALVLRALHAAESRRVALGFLLEGRFPLLRLGLLLAFAAVGLGAFREWRLRRRGESGTSALRCLRLAFVAAVLSWLLFLWRVQPFQRLWFDLALGLAAGVWALAVLVRSASPPRVARAGDLALFGLCAAAVGLELGLRAWASLRPSVLNSRVGAAPRERIARFRYAPGEVRFGFPFNSRGYYDVEPAPRRAGDERRRIVAIGDSFHVGMVPHAWHFTTICEELLDARIDCLGVPGIGPPEYVSLLVEEGLPLEPDEILLSVFVGNDLNVADVLADLPDPGLRAWFQRDQVLLFVLPARWARLRRERGRPGVRDAESLVASPSARASRAETARAFPWVADPALEEPSYSEETFLAIEATRALDVCVGTPPAFELFCRSMLAARRAAGDLPLRVLLIPDEFQVDDALWQRVRERAGRELERDAPQRLVTSWLAEQGIPYLDLLPVLRRIPPAPDGRRHLYHLRDTHFNARGNEVTARALADFLGDG